MSSRCRLPALFSTGLCPLVALLAPILADTDIYIPSKCEACEIAIDEGFNFVSSLVKTRRGMANRINLAYEFPHVLREDRVNVWNHYSAVHRANLVEAYLAPKEPQKSHWKSVEIKFVQQYGAKELDRKTVAQAAKGSGQIKREDLFAVREKECIELSGWCKQSMLREPPRPLNTCGACREVVRELLVDIRRRADSPYKVKLGLVEELFADICVKLQMYHEPKKAKYVQRVCEEILQDEHDDYVPNRLHKLLQKGPSSWGGLSSDIKLGTLEKQICTMDLLGCDYDSKLWRNAEAEALRVIQSMSQQRQAAESAEAADQAKKEKKRILTKAEDVKALKAMLAIGPQHVQCETTQGLLLIKLLPSVSPHGVRRLLELVKDGHFSGVSLFRSLPGFLVQFGQRVGASKWDQEDPIEDDQPRRRPKLTRGTLSFAGSGEHSRTNQLFFAYCRSCGKLGKQPWETAVGRLVGAESMATLDKIEQAHDYGDFVGNGGGPRPMQIRDDADGSYLSTFPKLDYIRRCSVVADPAMVKESRQGQKKDEL